MEYYKIIAFINGECTSDEKQEVESWIKDNNEEYNRIRYIWKKSQTTISREEINMEDAWEKINPEKRTRMHQRRSGTIVFKQIARIAAVLIILVSIGYFLYQIGRTSQKMTLVEITSGSDVPSQHTLPDGSSIWLNANSSLRYPKKFGKVRDVYLTGEAYFEVIRNPDMPFEVHSGNTVTKVLGTSFNIDAKNIEEKIQIDVVSGKVIFFEKEKEDNGVILLKGDQAIFNTVQAKITQQESDNKNFMAWKTHQLRFDKTPLYEVCKVLSEYYNVNFIADSNLLVNKNLSAVFKNKSLDDVLKVMEITLDIRAVSDDETIILSISE